MDGTGARILALEGGGTTVVPDAAHDPRFANNPFVTGEIAGFRFYASVPLETASGFVPGSLCVFSDTPGAPSGEQLGMLEILARQGVELLELQHRTLQLNRALDEVRRGNARLGEFAGRLSPDLTLTETLGGGTTAVATFPGSQCAAQ